MNQIQSLVSERQTRAPTPRAITHTPNNNNEHTNIEYKQYMHTYIESYEYNQAC